MIVRDLMRPGKAGLTLCRKRRAEGVATPIIMLTAKGDDFGRVLDLEMGIADHLRKPFYRRELHPLLKAVLRRSDISARRSGNDAPRFITFEGWQIDTAKCELFSSDSIVVVLSSAEILGL
jgi:DNA-binding response OmpR family regulator